MNIVTVVASDQSDSRASFSNHGRSLCALRAPGVSIYSTVTVEGGSYKSLGGTSMATPHVAGVFALVLAAQPGLAPTRGNLTQLVNFIDRVLDNVDPVVADPVNEAVTSTGGRLNANNAVLGTPNPAYNCGLGRGLDAEPVGQLPVCIESGPGGLRTWTGSGMTARPPTYPAPASAAPDRCLNDPHGVTDEKMFPYIALGDWLLLDSWRVMITAGHPGRGPRFLDPAPAGDWTSPGRPPGGLDGVRRPLRGPLGPLASPSGPFRLGSVTESSSFGRMGTACWAPWPSVHCCCSQSPESSPISPSGRPQTPSRWGHPSACSSHASAAT